MAIPKIPWDQPRNNKHPLPKRSGSQGTFHSETTTAPSCFSHLESRRKFGRTEGTMCAVGTSALQHPGARPGQKPRGWSTGGLREAAAAGKSLAELLESRESQEISTGGPGCQPSPVTWRPGGFAWLAGGRKTGMSPCRSCHPCVPSAKPPPVPAGDPAVPGAADSNGMCHPQALGYPWKRRRTPCHEAGATRRCHCHCHRGTPVLLQGHSRDGCTDPFPPHLRELTGISPFPAEELCRCWDSWQGIVCAP